jgi:LuxR family maltose regulon positive regulatory protein
LGDGDAEAAKVDCERAVELSSRRNETLVWVASLLVAAEIQHALGSKNGARGQLRLATDQIDLLTDPGILAERAATVQRQLRLPASTRPRVKQHYVEPLSDREMTLLRMLPGDLSQRELGRAMQVSFNTVKTYNRQIYRKLGVTSRDDAVAAARLNGLL